MKAGQSNPRAKTGRPKAKTPSTKLFITLSPDSARQLTQLKRRIFGCNSAVIATCIAAQHAQMKKETPNAFD